MLKALIAGAAFLAISYPAHAVGQCQKPSPVNVPANAAQMSVAEFKGIYEQGQTYMSGADAYLTCLNQIIYTTAPEDPIVSAAGKAHQDYASEWGPVWGELNLACIEWEVAHGDTFPGGCQPPSPSQN